MKKSDLVRATILVGSLLLQLSALCFRSRGAAGEVDLSFDPDSGINGTVNAIALQPSGKVIIIGTFTTVKGLMRSKIARLNADGSGDSSFNAGTVPAGWGHYIHAIASQSDAKVLVGHDNGLSRLNSDGSPDTNFIAGIDVTFHPRAIQSIVVQSDGKVIIGGGFATVTGTNYNYGIARLNANGSLDHSFNPGTGIGLPIDEFDPRVTSLALQTDGKVLIGGDFYSVDGTNRVGIARLNSNGSVDSTFDPGTGAAASGGYAAVKSVAVQSDGKVLIGGNFITVNGTNRNGIARLNANGSLDNSFNPGTGAYDVTSVALQSDGKVLIGGNFGSVNGTNRVRIARLNADGSLDSGFNLYVNHHLYSVVVQFDDKVLIGGSFYFENDTRRSGIARFNADGSLDGEFQPGSVINESFASLVALPDGKVLITGFVNGTNRYGSALLNANGSRDFTFTPRGFGDLTATYSTNCEPDHECLDLSVVNAIVAQPDGKVIFGGQSLRYNYDPNEGVWTTYYKYFVIRLNTNGSRDPSFELAIGPQTLGGGESVQALALQPDGKVVVAGYFNSTKGVTRNGIARLNANGSLDVAFNSGAGYGGYGGKSLALQSDGKVLIGGNYFISNGSNYIYGITRLHANGSLDNAFNTGTGTGAPAEVRSIALQPDGKVFVGGSFTNFNGANRNRIARVNSDGSLDNSFNPGTGPDGMVRAIALQSDGKILIVGDFFMVNGAVRPNIARLYGDSAAPSLNITRSNAFVIVSWPVTGLNFQLQENTNLSLPNSWSPVAQLAVTNAGQISVTVPTTAGGKFFRLESQ